MVFNTLTTGLRRTSLSPLADAVKIHLRRGGQGRPGNAGQFKPAHALEQSAFGLVFATEDRLEGMDAFLERHADRGWTTLDDFRGLRRDAIVAQSQIARPAESGYDPDDAREGYSD